MKLEKTQFEFMNTFMREKYLLEPPEVKAEINAYRMKKKSKEPLEDDKNHMFQEYVLRTKHQCKRLIGVLTEQLRNCHVPWLKCWIHLQHRLVGTSTLFVVDPSHVKVVMFQC